MKTGLILEGGAMRGMFTCGVLDVMMENGIRFDVAAGISAGAAFGCNFKSRQAGRALRYNKQYCRDPRYCGIRSLIKTGDLYGADFCYREIPDELDLFDRDAFKSDPMEFYAGATDVESGKIVYHKCVDAGPVDMEWIRASASMPLVSRIVELDGRKYLDGGVADPIPYGFVESIGCDRYVTVLTQPKGYIKEKDPTLPMVRIRYRKYPEFIKASECRHLVYNRQTEQIGERERSGEHFVIRPPYSLNIKRASKDPDELERVYRIGRREMTNRLDELKEYLK